MSRTIGLSLSFCIQRHLRQQAPMPDIISSSTMCKTREEYAQVIESYKCVYWKQFPAAGEELAWALWNEDRLQQPRCITGDWNGYGPNDYEDLQHPDGRWYVYEKDFEVFKLRKSREENR